MFGQTPPPRCANCRHCCKQAQVMHMTSWKNRISGVECASAFNINVPARWRRNEMTSVSTVTQLWQANLPVARKCVGAMCMSNLTVSQTRGRWVQLRGNPSVLPIYYVTEREQHFISVLAWGCGFVYEGEGQRTQVTGLVTRLHILRVATQTYLQGWITYDENDVIAQKISLQQF